MIRPHEQDWEASELGGSFLLEEGRRLLLRARSRMALILTVSVLLTTVYVIRRASKPASYSAKVVLRLVEENLETVKEVRPPRQYFKFIWRVCLSRPRLREIIQRFKIYPTQFARDPEFAIETFRNDLDVVVWSNYFLEGEHSAVNDEEAHTARFSITWAYKDPDTATAVVEALGETISEGQAEERRIVFRQAQEEYDDAEKEAKERLKEIRYAIAARTTTLSSTENVLALQSTVTLRDLRSEELNLSDLLSQLGSAKNRFEIVAAAERRRSGLRVELADQTTLLPQKTGGLFSIVLTALLIVNGTTLVLALVIGAFDSRIRQAADVRHLGMGVLGAIPSFRGDTVGSLVERLHAADELK